MSGDAARQARYDSPGAALMKNRAPIASRLLVVIVVVAIAVSRPTRAAGPTLETASIADINAAFAAGTLTSEQLVGAYLKRIDAYDKQGPAINAVLTPNPRALADARALDAERKAGNVRGPLHGIPIVLKDNYDTVTFPRPRAHSSSRDTGRGRTRRSSSGCATRASSSWRR